MTIITPEIKDKILFYLCNEAKPEQYNTAPLRDVLNSLDLDLEMFSAVINQFQRFGFLEDLNLRQSSVSFTFRIDAHDYAQKGGFIGQEEIFKSNIEKLLLEIDHLKKELIPDHLEKLNKISSIASAIFSGLSLYK